MTTVDVRTGWAVLGTDDRIVVLLAGADADEAAKDFGREGYTILPVYI